MCVKIYFSKSPQFHVHLLNIDLLPWSLGPILYTWLSQKQHKTPKLLLWKRNAQKLRRLEEWICNKKIPSETFLICHTYLHKDDHVPNGFDQYDVRTTLAQLLVLGETDLKEISSVLQRLHVCLHHLHSLIRLKRCISSFCCLNLTIMKN